MRIFLKKILRKIERKVKGVTKQELSPLLSFIDESVLWTESSVIRLGSNYGGWSIPRINYLDNKSVCYLVGAGEDVSFDLQLANLYNCRIRIVDPTPRAIKHFEDIKKNIESGESFSINNSKTEFYEINTEICNSICYLPYGLAAEDKIFKFFMPRNPAHVSCSIMNLQGTNNYFEAQCYRLISLMKKKGDMFVNLIKLDIEGGEYAVIEDLIKSNLLPEILLVEFDEVHTPKDKYAHQRIASCINSLSISGMQCIFIEGSNATFLKSTVS